MHILTHHTRTHNNESSTSQVTDALNSLLSTYYNDWKEKEGANSDYGKQNYF